MTFNRILFFVLLLVVAESCYYDVAEDLYPDFCNTEDISYSEDIIPILQTNCYSCHSEDQNQGGVTLEGYDELRVYVDDGSFLGSIKREPQYAPMPEDAQPLSSCTIDKIESWINDGALNN